MRRTILCVVIALFSFLILSSQVSAQQRSCGMEELMAIKLQDPRYKAKFEERRRQAFEAGQSNASRALCASPVVIPVAVHFQSAPNPIDQPCLVALAQSQIDILNDDYQGVNVDISNWINTDSNEFPGVNYGETCIEFCLATFNHPTGYGLTEGQPAVTINETNNSFDANWAGYINIWVRNIGALGFSPLGGDGDGDGVTIDRNAFGAGVGCNGFVPGAPYNLGRTLTHELGHYLNLDHIWGGGCGADDGVADTPNSSSSYGGCPTGYPSSCSSTDMYMNYMDYVNDLCMYMYSAGQSTVMENYVANSLQAVVNNAANVCAAPTCVDGVQNGNETGVDCGGPDCAPCPPTCTDGIQNGNETGVDCGGPDCPTCPPPPTCTDGVQNGNETGVDCGGPDCPICPPCIDVVITFNFDNYPEDISWEVEDVNNNVVASGDNYGSQPNGSTLIITECLPAGCYDFIITDSFGDGLCCSQGNGGYDVSSCGVSYASGGSFGSGETTNFCIYNEYVFLGTIDDDWDTAGNWDTNTVPPVGYECQMRVSANCKKTGALNLGGELIIDSGMRLTYE